MKFLCLLSLLLPVTLCGAHKPTFSFPGLKQDIEFAKAGEVSLTLDAFVPEGSGPFATCIFGARRWLYEGGQAFVHHAAV
jgi:alpha-L-fucosidase 2